MWTITQLLATADPENAADYYSNELIIAQIDSLSKSSSYDVFNTEKTYRGDTT